VSHNGTHEFIMSNYYLY